MSASVPLLPRPPFPPIVHFVEGRPEYYIGDPTSWRRASLEQEAYVRTGATTNPAESHVGIYVRRRQNGRFPFRLASYMGNSSHSNQSRNSGWPSTTNRRSWTTLTASGA